MGGPVSAIVGLYNTDGRPVKNGDVNRMLDSLAHRGPDGAAIWNEGFIGLGHRMLWTTPESLLEEQPVENERRDIALTADARIDNRAELFRELGNQGHRICNITDSQLILAAYEKWGESCPKKLLGDFAFVLWDRRNQVLFCARDPFGIKPLYYYERPGRFFCFASEIKALFCLPAVPRQLNEVRIADYLESLPEDKVLTFYEGVFRLPPAHSLRISRKGLQLVEYWALDPERDVRFGSNEEYGEAFLEIFQEAVKARLRSAFPVGFALSGGLDSSSVVGVAQKLGAANGHPPLHTFSAVFDDVPQSDERPFINLVLARGGVEPHFVHPDRLSALTDIGRVLWHQDQPMFIRNMFLLTTTYGAAQQQGVRVMLDGDDGDTVVSYGDGYLIELARAEKWAAFCSEANSLYQHFKNYSSSPMYWVRKYGFTHLTALARAGRWGAFVRGVHGISKHFDVSCRKLFLEQGLKPLAPELARSAWRALHRRPLTPVNNVSLVKPTFAQRVAFNDRNRVLSRRYTHPVSTLREAHWLSLTTGIISCIQEEDNKAAAAFGIEKRHPFWDRRLVEFCLALPPDQKLHQGWPRWVMRQAMRDILPDEIRWRVGKSNLGPNFIRSLLDFERERLEEVLLNNSDQAIENYVDKNALRHAYDRRDANRVWPAIILALWLKQKELDLIS